MMYQIFKKREWVKIAENEKGLLWKSNKLIGNSLNPLLIRVFEKNKKWVVIIGLFKDKSIKKNFRTKTEALNYIKNYMKGGLNKK